MKTSSLKSLPFIALTVAIVAVLWSCSKNELKPPVEPITYDLALDALMPGESIVADVAPGLYKIQRFTDTGDDETPQFNGYTFNFMADGILVATTGTGVVFTGRWRLNSAETRMTLVIGGTNALDDLDDDDWKVDRITNKRIRISANGPDIVIFVKI